MKDKIIARDKEKPRAHMKDGVHWVPKYDDGLFIGYEEDMHDIDEATAEPRFQKLDYDPDIISHGGISMICTDGEEPYKRKVVVILRDGKRVDYIPDGKKWNLQK
jgi:hypothetical protein